MNKVEFNVEGNWSFKERFKLSFFFWLISIVSFFAPKTTLEVILKELINLKRDSK